MPDVNRNQSGHGQPPHGQPPLSPSDQSPPAQSQADRSQPTRVRPDRSQSDQGQPGQTQARQIQAPEETGATQKKRKPSFEEFLADLTDAITRQSDKDDLPAVIRLLMHGYDGEVQPVHAEKVFDAFKNYRSADRLIVQLTTAMPKRPSAIARTVRNRLRSWIGELVRYPAATPGNDRLFELTDWIRAGDTTPRKGESSRYPPDWVRMAFASLTAEPDLPVRSAAVHRLLAAIVTSGNRNTTGLFRTDCQSFLREAGKLISAKTISVGRVTASLQFGNAFEEASRQVQAALSRSREEATEAAERSRTLTEENQRLQQQLDDALSRANRAQRELDQTRSELTVQSDRLKELEHHWETTSEQRLARLRHQVASDLGHDLQEARLALDRDSPNVEMGLNRIRKAEAMIRALDT